MSKAVVLTYFLFAMIPLSVSGQVDPNMRPKIRERLPADAREHERRQKEFENLRGIEVEKINLSFFKLSRDDKQLIAPSDADKREHTKVLRLPDSGIVKLLDISCQKVGAVKLDDACNNSIPGFGSYYSFRNERHLFPLMSDIQLFKGWFVSAGFLTQGIIVSLGETDFEKISLASTGVNFLSQFLPADTADGADKQRRLIEEGIVKDGFKYNRAIPVKENSIYAMRSIAYRSKAKTLDKRDDTIVVFKVIRKDSKGNVTLIWRKLKSITAPEIKTEK